MTPAAFKRTLAKTTPPKGLSKSLLALWWADKGDWERAHKIVQDEETPDAAWVHAYLHRVEGDLGNARYWYRQAKREPASGALKAEWSAISTELLSAARSA